MKFLGYFFYAYQIVDRSRHTIMNDEKFRKAFNEPLFKKLIRVEKKTCLRWSC